MKFKSLVTSLLILLPIFVFAQNPGFGAEPTPFFEMLFIKSYCTTPFDCILNNYILNPLIILPVLIIIGVIIYKKMKK